MTTERLNTCFAKLRAESRAAFVAYVMAGDPDPDTAFRILSGLPAAGADIIELGMPFSDPMAEGPPIQRAAQRSLKQGFSLAKTLEVARRFRQTDQSTPIVLMGYLNPILSRGFERFAHEAAESGVDGLIVVDCPPEEADPLADELDKAGVSLIRLATPTTDDKRLPAVLHNTSGFVYYVSITGITGMAAPDTGKVAAAVARIKRHTLLPVAVGFGVRTAAQARAIAAAADGVVVGSVLVDAVKQSLGGDKVGTVKAVTGLVAELAAGVRAARRVAAE